MKKLKLGFSKGLFGLDKAAWGVVMFIIILALGAMLLGGFRDQITDNTSEEYTIVTGGLTNLGTFSDWLPIIVLVIVVVVIFALVRSVKGEGQATM